MRSSTLKDPLYDQFYPGYLFRDFKSRNQIIASVDFRDEGVAFVQNFLNLGQLGRYGFLLR